MLFGKHFRRYYFIFGHLFLLGIAVLILVDWIQLDIPKLVGGIIDTLGSTNPDQDLVLSSIKTIGLLAIVITIGRFLWRYTIFGASRRIEFRLRNVMFTHATKLSQSYYSQEKVGGLMTYFINDLEAIRMTFGPGILMIVDGLMLGGFSLYRMANLNGRLTLYASIPMLALLIIMIFIRKQISKKFKVRQEAFEKLSDFTQENFSGITVIKAFVREIKEYMFFQKKNEDLYDKHLSFVKYVVIINIIVGAAINLVILSIVLFGSLLVINRDQTGLTAGQLTEYISYFFSLIWPVMALSQFMQIQGQAKASAERITKFLDHPYDVYDTPEAKNVQGLKGEIIAKNLTFQYPDGDSPVLKKCVV